MTPGIQVLLGAPPIIALATPLPAIFPTALAGALAYRRGGELDTRAAAWLVGPGSSARPSAPGSRTTSTRHCCSWRPPCSSVGKRSRSSGMRAARSTRTSRGDGPDPRRDRGRRRLRVGTPRDRRRPRDGSPARRVAGDAAETRPRHVAPRHRRVGRAGHDRPRRARPHRLGHLPGADVGAVPGARLGAALALGAKERTLRLVVGGGLLAISVALRRRPSGGDAESLSSAATIGVPDAQLARTTPRF